MHIYKSLLIEAQLIIFVITYLIFFLFLMTAVKHLAQDGVQGSHEFLVQVPTPHADNA
jgi:hypothetical protein